MTAGLLGAEARLFATFDTATRRLPRDTLLVEVLVSHLLRRERYLDAENVSSPPRCAAESLCMLLRGAARQWGGRTRSAEATFDSALVGMTSAQKCTWFDATPLLDSIGLESYGQAPCDARLKTDEWLWWLSDPSYLIPGNDRRSEHLARRVIVHADADYHRTEIIGAMLTQWAWGDMVDTVIRRGRSNGFEMMGEIYASGVLGPACGGGRTHSGESGWRGVQMNSYTMDELAQLSRYRGAVPAAAHYPSAVNGCARVFNTRARYQFTPDHRALRDPFAAPAGAWGLDSASSWPLRERYTPAYGPPIGIVDHQVARFIRGDSTLLVAAADLPRDTILARLKRERAPAWEAALLYTPTVPPGPTDLAIVRRPRAPLEDHYVFTALASPGPLFIALEVLTPDTLGFARLRLGVPALPTQPGRLRVSDILLFDSRARDSSRQDSLPRTLDSALTRVLGTTSLPPGSRVGLYWEVSGVAHGDMLKLTLSVGRVTDTGDGPGALSRLWRSVFGGVGGPGSRSIRWSTPAPSTLSASSPLGQSVVIDAPGPGRYAIRLRVQVGVEPAAEIERVITVVAAPVPRR